MKKTILLNLVVLLVTVVSAPAATHVVPGENAAIQAAIDNCNDGDTVIVHPGTYYENINFNGKAITVSSTNPDDPSIVESTIIDANGVGSVVTFANGEGVGAVLTGFTITGGYGTVNPSIAEEIYWGAGIYCYQASPTIEGNLIAGNHGPMGDGPDAGYGGGISCLQSSAVITRNIIKQNETFAGAGVMVYVGNDTITSNLIYDNSALIGGGVVLLEGGWLINNTIASNDATSVGNVYASGQCLIVNNIISNALNGGGIYWYDFSSIAYNNVWDNAGGNYVELDDQTGFNGNISSNPLFVDAEANDYHLQIDSPCINAGDPDFVAEPDETDIDGEPRIFAGRVDIGADEYIGYVKPIADAGPDQYLKETQLVTLDGSGSFFYDPCGIMEFQWTQTAGAKVKLSDSTTVQPMFNAKFEGEYRFDLVVSDDLNTSQADEVLIFVGVTIIQQDLHSDVDVGAYAHYGDVSGNKVVYAVGQACDYSWDIKYKDIEEPEVFSLQHGGLTIDTQPQIDGDIIVWSGNAGFPGYHGPECISVCARNIDTGVHKTLRQHSNSRSYSHPAVSGKRIVWLEHLGINKYDPDNWWNTPYNICGADITNLSSPVYFTIAENVGNRDPYPCYNWSRDFDDVIDISGNIVVWEGDGDIYGADISDLNDIRVFTICSDPARQFDPAISGNTVIWTDERNDGGDIYGADISDVENIEVFEIIKENGTQHQPAIDGRMMVHVDGGLYGEIKACFLARQGEQSWWLEIPLAEAQYGLGPAIDGETIIWQSDYYGKARGISLKLYYTTPDGPIENLTTGKRYDYIWQAIYAATDGDEIVASAGIYDEDIDFEGKNIILRSTDPNDPAIVAATVINGSSDVVTFSSGEDASCVLSGFTITGGDKGIYCSAASPTITNCIITENTGASLYCRDSEPTIINCTISENAGTGCYCWDSDIIVTNCTIAGNGGKGIYSSSPKGNDIAITNCAIAGNAAEGICFDNGDLTVTNCTVAENVGVGIDLQDANTAAVTSCTIDKNGGEGVSCNTSNLTIVDCTVTENVGSGIDLQDGSNATITNSTIAENTGAGIESWDAGNCAITDCTIAGNGTGGIYCDNSPSTISNCTIAENGADGIYSDSSPSTISNCTIAGNRGAGIESLDRSNSAISNCIIAGNDGAGIKSGISSSPAIINCTITENAEVGIFCHFNRKITTITNCIVWDNGAGQIVANSAPTSVTYSDVQGSWPGLDNIDADPCFVDTGYWDANGTPDDTSDDFWVEGDYHLLPDSLCVDTGDPNFIAEPNESDIDGQQRVINGRVDIGADEYYPTVPVDIDIDPDTFNLASEGEWITCYIRLPEDYDVADIEPNSVVLEGEIEAESLRLDGQVAIARFNRAEVQSILSVGWVELAISGQLIDGTVFKGTDVIRVIDKGGRQSAQ